jgi:hypothetical protein
MLNSSIGGRGVCARRALNFNNRKVKPFICLSRNIYAICANSLKIPQLT